MHGSLCVGPEDLVAEDLRNRALVCRYSDIHGHSECAFPARDALQE